MVCILSVFASLNLINPIVLYSLYFRSILVCFCTVGASLRKSPEFAVLTDATSDILLLVRSGLIPWILP